MVRKGHSDSVYDEPDDLGRDEVAEDTFELIDVEEDEVEGEDALGPALELVSIEVVSFVDCVDTHGGMLQRRSKQSVHLRRGAPIGGIAWEHCSIKLRIVRSGLSGVEYRQHGHRQVYRGLSQR